MKTLPYRAVTSSGAVIDCEFKLHPETVSPGDVARLVGEVLNALDANIEGQPPLSNGDVLQAVAMALALRTEMLAASRAMKDALARDLVERALRSVADAKYSRSGVGHA